MKNEKIITKLSSSRRGATMVEYALLAALVGVAVIGSVTAVAQQVDETFRQTSKAFGAEPVTPRTGE